MTTLVKQVIGLLKPTSGGITLGRYDLVADTPLAGVRREGRPWSLTWS